MDHNDRELIKRTLAGDEAAFGALVDRYKGAVHALVYRKTGDFHIAEELTQDAFLQAYQKLSTLRNPVHFAGWLYVIASRCCLMWYRKKRLPTSPLAKVKTDEMETIAQRDYDDDQQRQDVHDALDSLPESQRTVLTLHYLGGLSCKEIGRFIGTSEGAIKDRLYRARLRLREEITNMMQETLRGFQLPPTFTRKLLERIGNFEPTSAIPRSQPLIPWGIAGAVTIVLIVCASFTNGLRFQVPYSFNAEESATMVEIINAPIVDHAPLLPNQRGGQVVFQAAAQKEQDDAQLGLSYQDYQRWH
ncbi:RNA polymerase sigma factor, partial [Candidatus Poribacteria bacterium]|nr:RNA polymerase sigma factor [Candidatus Poribacteria bacterium]